jgi:lipopolysaccharide biosynthesis regulator YciM
MRKSLFIFGILIIILSGNQYAVAQELKLFDPSQNAQAKPPKTKQKLATEYYASGDYQKALPLFEELYDGNSSSYYYKYLLYCYVNLNEYKKAEKLIKKANKDNRKTYKELADLGYLQLQLGEVEKSEKLFSSAIKELPPDRAVVNELANDFRSRGQSDWAEKTYYQGKEILNGEYGFESELGYLYYYLEKYDQMTDAYLDLIGKDPNQMRVIQYRIQNAFRRSTEDVVYPYLKDELLKRIKKEENGGVYSELLLWLSIQRNDFNIAVIQAKALDKRDGGAYFRVFDLARIMLNNGDYKGSISALDFIVSRSGAKDEVIYPEAIQYLVSAKYQLLASQANPEPNDINDLSLEYEAVLEELGKFKFTINTVMEYAELLFYYQDKRAEAILELETLIENQGLSKKDRAPLKLLLGDLYLLDGNPWEATLLYSQVEKDFKNDEFGFESRLKNAKLSFYIGEFDWAKAQLDILKGATDRKIANDAMNLSLLISENLDADSNTRALELFGRADLLHLQNNDSLAIVTLDSIFFISLYHELHDNVWMKQAQIYASHHEYNKSRDLLYKIVQEFPDGLLADDAIWMMAKDYPFYSFDRETTYFNDVQSSADLYRKILTDYPASLYVQEARKIYRKEEADKEKAEPL